MAEYRCEQTYVDSDTINTFAIQDWLNAFASDGWRVILLTLDNDGHGNRAMFVTLERTAEP